MNTERKTIFSSVEIKKVNVNCAAGVNDRILVYGDSGTRLHSHEWGFTLWIEYFSRTVEPCSVTLLSRNIFDGKKAIHRALKISYKNLNIIL